MRTSLWIGPLALASLLFPPTTFAADRPVKPREAVEYRQSVYNVIGWHWSPLAAMVKKQKEYDPEEFLHHASIINTLSPLPIHRFTEDTRDIEGSKARPEIWTNWADFSQKMENMNEKSEALLNDARTHDMNKIKKSFLEAARACKSCHDDYRNK